MAINDYLTIIEAIERTIDKYGARQYGNGNPYEGVNKVFIFNAHNKGRGWQRKNLICAGELNKEQDGNITFTESKILKHKIGATGRIYRKTPTLAEIADWKVTKYMVHPYDKQMLIIYAEPVATTADLNDGLEASDETM